MQLSTNNMSSRTEHISSKRDEVDAKMGSKNRDPKRSILFEHRVFLMLTCYVLFILFYYTMADNSVWRKKRPTYAQSPGRTTVKDCTYSAVTLVRTDLQPYPPHLLISSGLLRKQEYDVMVYVHALRNAVKLVDVPDTRLYQDAVRGCRKQSKDASLEYMQHSLEMRFPKVLKEMHWIAQSNSNSSSLSSSSTFSPEHTEYGLLWQNHPNVSQSPTSQSAFQSKAFEKPLFYYLQSYLYYVVFHTYKRSGTENWDAGEKYLMEIGKHITTKSQEWHENMGLDFISPASHPKSGPLRVHPTPVHYFNRQTFLRTDFDFTGFTPKDIIVPYYVPQDLSASHYASTTSNIATSFFEWLSGGVSNTMPLPTPEQDFNLRGTSRGQSTSMDAPRTSIFFSGGSNPPGGIRDKFQAEFQRTISQFGYTDVLYATNYSLGEVEYMRILQNTDFCLTIRGDTASSKRLFSAINEGCIPVIVSDWIHLPFETLIDYSLFTIRFAESAFSNVRSLIEYLKSVSEEEKTQMKRYLSLVRGLLIYEASYQDDSLHLLNPITMTLVEAFMRRKTYCDQLRRIPQDLSTMCEKLYDRLKASKDFKMDNGRDKQAIDRQGVRGSRMTRSNFNGASIFSGDTVDRMFIDVRESIFGDSSSSSHNHNT